MLFHGDRPIYLVDSFRAEECEYGASCRVRTAYPLDTEMKPNAFTLIVDATPGEMWVGHPFEQIDSSQCML